MNFSSAFHPLCLPIPFTARPALAVTCAKLSMLSARAFISVLILTMILFTTGGCTSLDTTGLTPTPSGQIATSVAGSGGPVIVFQSGLGDGKDSWRPVFHTLSASNQVFAYDRPGYGRSPAAKSPRDPCTIAAELRSTLKAAGISPPYILVGHSIGGLYQYAYARLYPEDVAGVVLIDPTHPDHWNRMQQEAPAAATVIKGLRATVFSATSRSEFDAQNQCLGSFDAKSPLAVPVRLLTKTKFTGIERGAFETMVHSLENDWMRLLGAKSINRVRGAGHYIHHDQPDIVVQEIRALIKELPARSP